MECYEVIFNEDDTIGVFGVSLVKEPAMQGNFIALNSQKPIEFKDFSKEERKVIGLILEPDKMIYRRDEDGSEYNIFMTKDTIKKLSYNLFKKGFHKNSTIEHDSAKKITDVTFVESWIVEDVEKDKQSIYGFSYPVGSWLGVLKIDNDDVWENYVKTGQVMGFSIDAFLELKKSNMIEQSLNEIKELIKTAFTKKEPIKLGSIKSADGSVVIEYEGEELVAGVMVWVNDQDGQRIPLPVGEYAVEGGLIIVINEDGLIGEVKEEQPAGEEPIQEEQPAEPMQQSTEAANEAVNAIKSILVKYQEVESNQKELEKKLDKVLTLLSEQPQEKTIKAKPSQVDLSKMTKKEKLLMELKQI